VISVDSFGKALIISAIHISTTRIVGSGQGSGYNATTNLSRAEPSENKRKSLRVLGQGGHMIRS